MSYYASYCAARRRYREACSEITSCTNRINTYTDERRRERELLNSLKLELKRHKAVLSQLVAMIAKEDSLNKSFSTVKSRVADASANYIKSVVDSNVSAKDLTVVYERETTATGNTLSGTFGGLRSEKRAVEDKIAELERLIRECEGRIDTLTSGINRETTNREDWKRRRNNASWDAEYYWDLYQEELNREDQSSTVVYA